ncbi:3-hydroxyacyl-CoA dehydrogenase NAD-binding domain-containing protein [Halalkalibaculum sp. DA384]
MTRKPSKKDLVGIVGAGTMGTGIARIAATFGHNVRLYDSYPDQLGNAKHNLRNTLQQQVEKDQITQQKVNDIMERINFSEDMTGFASCRLVIEAVPEDLEIKRDVFRRIEGIVPNDCILATNTSSLSIASISSALKRPGRFLGIHFFNPAPRSALVEIIAGIASDRQPVETARHLMEQWGKTTVASRDTPGFIVNRVGRPFYGEALRQLEEGVADISTIDWAMKEIGGFAMGPFERMDLVGNDINYKVTKSIFEAFYYDPRFKPSFTQKRMMEAGYLGQKSGKGFYEYGRNATRPTPVRDRDLGKKIADRILVMLINEAADAVFMNIASVEEIDLAMRLGANYPKGLLEWADEKGLKNVLDQLTALHVEYREDRYRPNPLIKHKVRNEDTFC